MRAMRVYSRRVYRNTILFGCALLAAAVAVLVADIWLLTGVPGVVRTIAGFADTVLWFLGAAYIVAGLFGLAKATK